MSLPSRERGLKFVKYVKLWYHHMSLPSRERGLKFVKYVKLWYHHRSLPSRERGLKYISIYINSNTETVAPLAGARIEIKNHHNPYNQTVSLPSRERGLK